MQPNDAFWMLDELGARVALALATDYPGQANGRVRDVPDRRTIRFYTTLGLIDRPAALRGRTALYGRRHLLQLVAIKRLQANGLSLEVVQQRLLGLSNAALARIARLPANLLDDSKEDADTAYNRKDAVPDRREASFWTAEPAPVRDPRPIPLAAVPLEAGVTLLLKAARPLDDIDLSGLREAAGPLLKFLRARRLLGPDNPGDTIPEQQATPGESP
jgi:DNA-binding transcriptional MerR regulator